VTNQFQSEDGGRVIWLPPRRTKDGASAGATDPSHPRSSLGNFGEYEGGADPDDYRHRMVVNLFAFLFCIFLVFAGVWLATKMAEMRKNQDCVLSGRRGCTPVDVPLRQRW
jgi:hypothetical protein